LTWKLINVHHNRRWKILEYLETIANLVIGKDLVHYGRKRASRAAAEPAQELAAASS
jgi:hypothetical protein